MRKLVFSFVKPFKKRSCMRFKITLKRVSRENQIPASYAYELHSALLKILHQADERYADFIHNAGHQVPDSRKNFKLFCFSQLFIMPFEIEGNAIRVKGDRVSFQISFYVDKTAENFIIGLFKNQKMHLGNRFYQTDFVVENVEVLPLPVLEACTTLTYRLHSPLFVVRRNGRDAHDTYLSPRETDYISFLKSSLIDKYLSVHQSLPTEWQEESLGFEIEILGGEQAKEKLITIKEGKEKATLILRLGLLPQKSYKK
ncbi:MAG: CRISPR-associated endoribonuclease Cas6 [Cytophagales bacterium]|nr:MAG: CRISPR-associated endoribonuclease Cas6 [Cytophagales bacterium]